VLLALSENVVFIGQEVLDFSEIFWFVGINSEGYEELRGEEHVEAGLDSKLCGLSCVCGDRVEEEGDDVEGEKGDGEWNSDPPSTEL